MVLLEDVSNENLSLNFRSLTRSCNHPDVQEIFGSHFTLPELGPLGGNGLANPRDFETPLASFDIDQSPWDIVYKLVRAISLFETYFNDDTEWPVKCTSATKNIRPSMS